MTHFGFLEIDKWPNPRSPPSNRALVDINANIHYALTHTEPGHRAFDLALNVNMPLNFNYMLISGLDLGGGGGVTDQRGGWPKSISDPLFGAEGAENFEKWPTFGKKLAYGIVQVPKAPKNFPQKPHVR